MSVKFAADAEGIERILSAINKNDGYCPCMIEKTENTKCPCLDFRTIEKGECHCGLFVKGVFKKDDLP